MDWTGEIRHRKLPALLQSRRALDATGFAPGI
jgi:hypothetical protein